MQAARSLKRAVAGTLIAVALLHIGLVHYNKTFIPSVSYTVNTTSKTRPESIPTSDTLDENIINTNLTTKLHLPHAILKASFARGALTLPRPVLNETDPTAYFAPFYNHVQCVNEKSNKPCSFPLLTEHFKRCGYFAESTDWREQQKGYPKAAMTAEICKVPSVMSGAPNLKKYITERNITGIVIVGDSQASRMNKALIELFGSASFQCLKLKKEPRGKRISLEYYTQGSGFKTKATAGRICSSCDSSLHVCNDTAGHRVSVEYISMDMGSRKPIHLTGSECRDKPQHPLCLNLTQQEYVFKYYLNRNKVYPELLLIFSVFAHTVFNPLQEGFDAIRDKWKMITETVPETSNIIWYGGTPYNTMKMRREPETPEGMGLPVNNKMQILNHFLAAVINNHFAAGRRPVYTFFDMYHMQERLKEAWSKLKDSNHFQPVWYQYVMAYTAAMLNSLPLQ